MSTETKMTDLVAAVLAEFETELNQTIPANRRAWFRVLGVAIATVGKGILKLVTGAQLAVFAKTAKEAGLKIIGDTWGITREPAVKWVGVVSIPCASLTSVSSGQGFTSDSTGAYYTCTEGGTEPSPTMGSGYVTITVTANDAGYAANLEVDETMTPIVPISGATGVGEVDSVTTYGQDVEDLEVWRARVLAEIRKTSGGGNLADYRDRVEAVSGVSRAYPYSGKPIVWAVIENIYVKFDSATNQIQDDGDPNRTGIFSDERFGVLNVGDMIQVIGSHYNDGFYTVTAISMDDDYVEVAEAVNDESAGWPITLRNESQPGDRTVFVKSTDESADYVPTSSLLSLCRDAIETSDDGTTWTSVGDVDSTLFLEPVVPKYFTITIHEFTCGSTQETAAKAAAVSDLTAFMATREPFCEGLDFEMDRKDSVSIGSLSACVQRTFDSYGATFGTISLEVDSGIVTKYLLQQGEIALVADILDEDGNTWIES